MKTLTTLWQQIRLSSTRHRSLETCGATIVGPGSFEGVKEVANFFAITRIGHHVECRQSSERVLVEGDLAQRTGLVLTRTWDLELLNENQLLIAVRCSSI